MNASQNQKFYRKKNSGTSQTVGLKSPKYNSIDDEYVVTVCKVDSDLISFT